MSVNASFVTKLIMEPLDNKTWQLRAPFVYNSKKFGYISVPKFFVTDLNSIPRLAWMVSPPSHFPRAAVLHDYYYRTKAVSRSTADALYREALELEGANVARRWFRWLGIRAFGWMKY